VRITPLSLLATVLCLLSAAARADEWVADRRVSARVTYYDNFNMQPTDPQAATNLSLTPSLTLSNRTEAREASVSLAGTVNRYLENPEYNTFDYRATFNLKWAGELDQRSITLASVRDSTLTSELATTGVVLARRQRTQTTAQAAWSRSLTERTSVNAALGLVAVRYEPAPGLVDFHDRSVSGGVRHALSERASVGASLSAREYQTDSGDVKSGVRSASVSGQMKYSERLSLSLDAGRDRTRTDYRLNGLSCPLGFFTIGTDPRQFPLCLLVPNSFQTVVVPVTTEVRGTTFNGVAAYQLENGSLSASLGRNLNASGTGSLLRSDQVSLNYQRRFSEKLEFAFAAGLVRSRSVDNAAGETRFTRLSPSLQWNIDEWTSLSAGYSYGTQIATGQTQEIRSNQLFVGISHGFRPLSVSR
jgi:hypothetical protein